MLLPEKIAGQFSSGQFIKYPLTSYHVSDISFKYRGTKMNDTFRLVGEINKNIIFCSRVPDAKELKFPQIQGNLLGVYGPLG